jgi:hypothetical protein
MNSNQKHRAMVGPVAVAKEVVKNSDKFLSVASLSWHAI